MRCVNLKRAMVDYRQFRLKRINEPQFAHVKLWLTWGVYFALYFLTENLIPAVIHVKQYDHIARRIGCALYLDSVLYQIPDGAIVNCTGTRPDGNVFQYSTETDPDVLYLEKAIGCRITYISVGAEREAYVHRT